MESHFEDEDPITRIKRRWRQLTAWINNKILKTEEMEKKKRAKDDLRKVYQEQYDLTYMEERSKFLMDKAKRDAEKAAKKDTSFTGTMKEVFGLR